MSESYAWETSDNWRFLMHITFPIRKTIGQKVSGVHSFTLVHENTCKVTTIPSVLGVLGKVEEYVDGESGLVSELKQCK